MAKVFTIAEGLENLGALKTGGQGSVYKGRRIGEIITAIKLLPTPIYSESASDKNFTAFQNEVQKLKKVNEEPNPNVVKILSYGITDSGNFPYIEMEFIEGPDLEELLKAPHEAVFTVKETLKVADHLSCALAHCHKADVRHGDIKSNNVKYNVSTGNYVLLDFGLSVMSDEQRRTSIRHAGAIEFMAPEQNEGQMLFQTDVYSFGVILFELLAGQVPFPLNDKGETARNKVMLAHIETLPPDVLTLRQQALPDTWSNQKKKEEMQVPDWLTNMMYKCLEKKTEDRFENGIALHKYIWEHTLQQGNNSRLSNETVSILEHENKKLRREKEQLQQQLLYQQSSSTSGSKTQVNSEINTNSAVLDERTISNKPTQKQDPFYKKSIILALAVLIAVSAIVYVLINNQNSNITSLQQRRAVSEYKIIAPRAYLYKDADENTRTNSFAIPGNETVKAFDEKNGFLYSQITDQRVTQKGWLRKRDVMKSDEWVKRNKDFDFSKHEYEAITQQLKNAGYFLSNGKTVEALIIYNSLAKEQVSEAMYVYGKLALQNLNNNITCTEAFNLLKKAADKNYVPAKRTLGFLYSYAEDKEMLQQNNYYEPCRFGKNLRKGAKLLMEATLAGDTAASRLLDEINTVR